MKTQTNALLKALYREHNYARRHFAQEACAVLDRAAPALLGSGGAAASLAARCALLALARCDAALTEDWPEPAPGPDELKALLAADCGPCAAAAGAGRGEAIQAMGREAAQAAELGFRGLALHQVPSASEAEGAALALAKLSPPWYQPTP